MSVQFFIESPYQSNGWNWMLLLAESSSLFVRLCLFWGLGRLLCRTLQVSNV